MLGFGGYALVTHNCKRLQLSQKLSALTVRGHELK